MRIFTIVLLLVISVAGIPVGNVARDNCDLPPAGTIIHEQAHVVLIKDENFSGPSTDIALPCKPTKLDPEYSMLHAYSK